MQKLYSNIYIIDSTRLTKEGWTGGFKLQNIFDGISTEQAEHAIIVFDEFDKLCEPLYGSGGSNYSTSMQNELSVSYTHLDVYKRQITHRKRDCR